MRERLEAFSELYFKDNHVKILKGHTEMCPQVNSLFCMFRNAFSLTFRFYRAVYRKADIYLLDDPLSAVDAHVSRHLFSECIQSFLKDKTRILVTHQVQVLTSADHVVLLEKVSLKSKTKCVDFILRDLNFMFHILTLFSNQNIDYYFNIFLILQ